MLTGLSGFWFARTRELVPNHLLALRDDGRSTECRRLEMLPIECVVRGYLSGSGWKDYLATGEVCGHRLPDGLVESQRLPAADLHAGDEGADRATTRTSTAPPRSSSSARSASTRSSATALALYALRLGARARARDHPRRHEARVRRRRRRAARARRRGVHARLVALLAGRRVRARARTQPSFDKQFVRDYCESLGWDKTDPGPELPDDVVEGTRARYVEAFERLTGISFDDVPRRPDGRARMKATVLVRPKPGILDPQGQAVESSLRHLGFAVGDARVGRLVDVELATDDRDEARAQLERMCEQLLDEPADRELRDRAASSA